MRSDYLSIQLIIAIAVLVAFLLHRSFGEGAGETYRIPEESKRTWWSSRWTRLVVIAAVSFGIASSTLDYRRLGHLRRSLDTLRQLDRIEECGTGGENKGKVLTSGNSAFEKWADEIRQGQKQASAGKATKAAFTAADGKQCDLRQKDEPWLHYRLRRLQGKLGGLGESREESGLAAKARALPARLALAWDDWNDHFRIRYLQGGSGQSRPVYIWSEPGIGPSQLDVSRTLADLSPDIGLRQSTPLVLGRVLSLLIFAKVHSAGGLDRIAPVVRNLATTGSCQALARSAELDSQAVALANAIRIRMESCGERLKNRTLARESSQCDNRPVAGFEPCDPASLTRALTFTCIERGPAGSEVKREARPLEWNGLSREAGLKLQVLTVPEDYFESRPAARTARMESLAVQLAQAIDPLFMYRAQDREVAGSESEMTSRARILEGSEYELTRLGALELMNPFGGGDEIGDEAAALMHLGNPVGRLEELIRQFRASYRAHKEEGLW